MNLSANKSIKVNVMIKSRSQVEMVVYESPALAAFYQTCKEQGRGANNIWCDISGEISNDLQWEFEDDMVSWTGKGALFNLICISSSAEEIIEVIEKSISNYDLEDYF